MGVNLGVLPTKGLTLPLMSYGGSAIADESDRARDRCCAIDYREPGMLMRGGPAYRRAPRSLDHGGAAPAATSFPASAVGRSRDARARLARELARHAHGHGEPARAAARHRARHASTFPACAARACAHADAAPCSCCGAFWQLPAASCARAAPTWCSAWAATSRFPGGMMARCSACRWCCVNADAALLLTNSTLLPVADRVPSASTARQW